MKKTKSTLVACSLATAIFVSGCGDSTSSSVAAPGSSFQSPVQAVPPLLRSLFQNPFLSPNPGSNIHNDSYLSDTYPFPGPVQAGNVAVSQVNLASFTDPDSGQRRSVVLGIPAGQAYDAQGNIQSVTAGLVDPINGITTRSIVTIDKNTLQVLAYQAFTISNVNPTDFGGAGYFYQDNQFRMVVALPDGHIKVLQRQPSTLSTVDKYVPVRDINVVGPGGAIAPPAGVPALSLYAVVPDKVGNIWFTLGQGIVGFITPNNQVNWLDTNDPNNTGTRTAQPDGDFQEIANSHSIDEGDSASGSSGIYILTTHKQYRFGVGANGKPEIIWEFPYDRGTGIKPGQVSHGSGSSPTVFEMGGRRFVTIVDNGSPMKCNVYRAESTLLPGENRLFAQTKPFGDDLLTSDENSLIVAPAPSGGGTDIFAENNYGYLGIDSVKGTGVTRPGFSRMRLETNGNFSVGSFNGSVAPPTLVSKMSVPGQTVYTYEKKTDGWYLTAMDSNDLNNLRFSVFIGPGETLYNNHYSALSLDPDGKTVFVGTVGGLTKIVVNGGK